MVYRVFITGSTGFVGKNLVKYLNGKGSVVFPISLRSDSKLPDELGDVVIHLAGKAHDIKKVDDMDMYYKVNTELTKKVFDAFLNSNCQTFIFLSSVKAISDSVKEETLTEQSIPDPKTNYGKSKLLAEQYLFSKKTPPDKKLYILRPCMIHGPENKGNLNLLYKFVKKGIPYPLASFNNKRSFLSVENLCFVIDELIKRNDIESGIYNVADNTPLSTNDIIQMMANANSKRKLLWHMPKKLVITLARIGDLIHFPLNSERLKKLTENYVVSNNKLILALNKQLPISSEEGMRRTIQSFTHVC